MEKEQYSDNIEIALQAINNPEIRNSKQFRDWIKVEDNLRLYEELVLYRTAMHEEKAIHILENFAWSEFISGKQKAKRSKLRQFWLCTCAVASIVIFFLVFTNTLTRKPVLSLETNIIPEFIAKTGPQEITLSTNETKPVVIDFHAGHQFNIKPKHISTIVQEAKITQDEDIKTYNLSIPRGRSYHLILEDGTEVWLNSDSKLIFPVRFKNDEREVELIGEGYFKVKKDTSRPFIVKSNNLTAKVLGTEFNFRAYDIANAEITLVSGKIAVSKPDNDGGELIITPNQTVSLVDNNMLISEVEVKKYTSWLSGLFYFDNEPLEDIMKELGRWYNINIMFKDNTAKNLRFKFGAFRNNSLEQTVEMLNRMGKVSIEINGKDAIIKEDTKED